MLADIDTEILTQALAALLVAAVTYVARVTRKTSQDLIALEATTSARLGTIETRLDGIAADLDRIAPRPSIRTPPARS